MKIRTSYFYQIRFFKPYMIPMSTAVWDPKWFHQNNGHGYKFNDNNGVINGLRIEEFAPDDSCKDLCRGPNNCASSNYKNCEFLQNYRKQLDKYNIDEVMNFLQGVADYYQDKKKFTEDPIIVLIVYETPDNPCSERKIIQEYFLKNLVHCQELTYPIKYNYK